MEVRLARKNIFSLLATILLLYMGLIISICTLPSPKKKYFCFWVHYYYYTMSNYYTIKSFNQQWTPSELILIFFSTAQWWMGIGKSVRSPMKSLGNALGNNYLAQLVIFCNLHLYLIFSSSPTNCRWSSGFPFIVVPYLDNK